MNINFSYLTYLSLTFLLSFPVITSGQQSAASFQTDSPRGKTNRLNDNLQDEIIYLKDLYQQYREYVVFNDAPYKGLAFQLDGQLATTPLWNGASFGIGAFTWDFKDEAGRDVGGILFDHPVFIGWDFQLYKNLNLTAGTTLLESRKYLDNTRRTILFNSFIGLNGKFNLNW